MFKDTGLYIRKEITITRYRYCKKYLYKLQKCSKCYITLITNVQQINAQNLKAQKMKSSLAVTTAVRWHPVNLASLIRKQNCA